LVVAGWWSAYYARQKKLPTLQSVVNRMKDKDELPDEKTLKERHRELVKRMRIKSDA